MPLSMLSMWTIIGLWTGFGALLWLTIWNLGTFVSARRASVDTLSRVVDMSIHRFQEQLFG